MAVLQPPSERVTADDGTPISGGQLRVYDINTTTLSSLYSNEAMSTPLTNPVEADSNGFLPMIFAAAGTYDIAYLDSVANGGADLTGQSYTDQPTIGGSTANTISATLSGARFKVSGGDIGDGTTGVLTEHGNPSPDDTGGYARDAGWAGTQGDKKIFDWAIADFTQTKSLREGAKRISSVLYTDATAFSAASTVNIQLPNTPTITRAWRITIWDLYLSAAESLAFRIAYDATPTFKSGASDYAFAVIYNNAGTIATVVDDAHTHIRASHSLQAASTWLARMELIVTTVDSGNGNTTLGGHLFGAKTNAGAGNMPANERFDGVGLGNYGRATYIQLLTLTGGATLTGKYNVETLRGFGE